MSWVTDCVVFCVWLFQVFDANYLSYNINYANVQAWTKAHSSFTGASNCLHYPTASKTGFLRGKSGTRAHTHTKDHCGHLEQNLQWRVLFLFDEWRLKTWKSAIRERNNCISFILKLLRLSCGNKEQIKSFRKMKSQHEAHILSAESGATLLPKLHFMSVCGCLCVCVCTLKHTTQSQLTEQDSDIMQLCLAACMFSYPIFPMKLSMCCIFC